MYPFIITVAVVFGLVMACSYAIDTVKKYDERPDTVAFLLIWAAFGLVMFAVEYLLVIFWDFAHFMTEAIVTYN